MIHLGRKEVAKRVGVCTRTLARMCGAHEFPTPLQIRGRPKWPAEVVDGWFEQQLQRCLDKQGRPQKIGRGA